MREQSSHRSVGCVGQSCVGCLSLFSRERELLRNKLKEFGAAPVGAAGLI